MNQAQAAMPTPSWPARSEQPKAEYMTVQAAFDLAFGERSIHDDSQGAGKAHRAAKARPTGQGHTTLRQEAEANRRAARQRAEEAVLARRLRTVGDLWDRYAKEVVAIENKPSTVPQKSAPMAPAKSPDEAAELLSALLRVQSEG